MASMRRTMKRAIMRNRDKGILNAFADKCENRRDRRLRAKKKKKD